MIPKPLNEIDWSDIEALRDSGREEDDTIEYKGSFSGGFDYLAFNDSKRAKAIEGIAREAVAFLNGRGGDIIIGVREAANDHPKIEEITSVSNIDQTVSRLEQSLAALIEPVQTVLGIRAVRKSDGDSDGVIIVRCPSSLRAPHRFKPTKECYVRRGRSSVPMPMDEVQDLTLNREVRRSEMFARLTQRMNNHESLLGRKLPGQHIHIKFGLASYQLSELLIDQTILRNIDDFEAQLKIGAEEPKNIENEFYSERIWKPMPRGYFTKYLHEYEKPDRAGCRYRQREVFRDGMIILHIADNGVPDDHDASCPWFVRQTDLNERLANSIGFFRECVIKIPAMLPAIFRVEISIDGPLSLGLNRDSKQPFIARDFTIPDWEVKSDPDFRQIFMELREDIYNSAAIQPPYPAELV